MTLHPHDLAALAEHVEHGEFVLCTSAATLTSWLDALERMQPPKAPVAAEPAARLALVEREAPPKKIPEPSPLDRARGKAILQSITGGETWNRPIKPRTKPRSV